MYYKGLKRNGYPVVMNSANVQDIVQNIVQDNCGTVTTNGSQPVINGHDAPEKSYPWQAYLHGETKWRCGGVLISSQWVLTAAHCLTQYDLAFVVLGIKNLVNQSSNYVIRTPMLQINHPKYNNFDHDIALIKINEAVEFNDYIRPACLPQDDNTFESNNECFLTGFGFTDLKIKFAHKYSRRCGLKLFQTKHVPIIIILFQLT
jgi:hypothetical protein